MNFTIIDWQCCETEVRTARGILTFHKFISTYVQLSHVILDVPTRTVKSLHDNISIDFNMDIRDALPYDIHIHVPEEDVETAFNSVLKGLFQAMLDPVPKVWYSSHNVAWLLVSIESWQWQHFFCIFLPTSWPSPLSDPVPDCMHINSAVTGHALFPCFLVSLFPAPPNVNQVQCSACSALITLMEGAGDSMGSYVTAVSRDRAVLYLIVFRLG